MKKIYELRNMNGYHLVTSYMGIKIEVEFRGGNALCKQGGKFATSNPFIQDGIEADSRFGKLFFLKEKFAEEGDEAQRPKTVAKQSKTKSNSKQPKTDEADEYKSVENIKTFNDACDFFAEYGEVCDSGSDVEALCEKHRVKFPNLTL